MCFPLLATGHGRIFYSHYTQPVKVIITLVLGFKNKQTLKSNMNMCVHILALVLIWSHWVTLKLLKENQSKCATWDTLQGYLQAILFNHNFHVQTQHILTHFVINCMLLNISQWKWKDELIFTINTIIIIIMFWWNNYALLQHIVLVEFWAIEAINIIDMTWLKPINLRRKKKQINSLMQYLYIWDLFIF